MRRFASHGWWLITAVLAASAITIAGGTLNVFSPGAPVSSSQINDNFKNLADRLATLEAASRPPVATYVRWGRTECPTTATAVYVGYAAGSHYDHKGNGAETLCLPEVPQWLTYDEVVNAQSVICGTEFETSGTGLASLASLQDWDGKCVVCQVPRSATLMIPAWNSCPTGWTLEFNGYLMSQNASQYKSDWVCVDAHPQQTGSSANLNGHLWYPTEVACGGSLPCMAGGYIAGRELACAVCTQ